MTDPSKPADPPLKPEGVTKIIAGSPPGGGTRRADTFRARLNAPIIASIETPTGERVALCTGVLRDLSLQGALITELRLPDGVTLNPDTNYTIKFKLMAGPLTGMEAECSAVRYDAATRSFGVRIPEGFKLPLA